MDRLDYWRLCTDFTVVQAALVVCGVPPDNLQYEVERNSSRQPEGYVAIRTAFQNALNSGRLKPSRGMYTTDFDGEPTTYFEIESTTVSVEEIDRFLKSVGVQCDFFDRGFSQPQLPSSSQAPMPAKLNAAVKAWAAVASDPARLRGKSPKQALDQWLTENAAELGLLNRNGQPNRTGIEEICKVANWKPLGGAPPTPTSSPLPAMAAPDRPLIRLPLPPRGGFGSGRRTEARTSELDEEIPF